MDKVKGAIEEYYALKRDYDEKHSQEKKKISRDKKLGNKSKRKLISQIVPVCVSCKRKGGTSFTHENRKIFAICKAKTPCKLNIEIDIGEYEKINNSYKTYTEEYQYFRTGIIRTKLDMLFGYITESVAVSNFESMKGDFDEVQQSITIIGEMFENINQSGRNKDAVKALKTVIESTKLKINDTIKMYKTDKTPEILADIIGMYVDELYKSTDELRKLVYVKNEIECSDGLIGQSVCEDGIYRLVQEPYFYSEVEIEHELPAVIINNK